MKYCAAAAGALGLTTTDLVKLEKALATPASIGGTQIVWVNGAACTGCTVSFANTAYYSSVQDLLVPWATTAIPAIQAADGRSTSTIVGAVDSGVLTDTGADGALDLVFSETLSSAVGFRALNAAKSVLATSTNSTPFVLVVEGAIQTESNGNYCRIGNGTNAGDLNTISFKDEVLEFAKDENCLAVLAVGTCASFGGIPAARGSVTGARGLISSGRITGGYTAVNNQGLWDYLKGTKSGLQHVSTVTVTVAGDGYTVAPTVTFTAPGTVGGVTATGVASLNTTHGVAYVAVTNHGSGYTAAPTISIPRSSGETGTTLASATATMADDYYLSAADWTTVMGKTVCVSGCPPHPDWIVGTIVYILTYGEPPLTDKYHRPLDFYGQYQCTNCQWKTNNPAVGFTADNDINLTANKTSQPKGGTSTVGDSPKLFKNKYGSVYEGCLGVLGCKGRKTKADCSYRRWNSDAKNAGGISWCVQTRAGCHGCTEPRYPDGWGKFFSFK